MHALRDGCVASTKREARTTGCAWDARGKEDQDEVPPLQSTALGKLPPSSTYAEFHSEGRYLNRSRVQLKEKWADLQGWGEVPFIF